MCKAEAGVRDALYSERVPRKSTPKVRDGRVQKKNNWEASASYRDHGLPYPALERQRPGDGFRHLLRRPQIESFIALLPDWDELSVGLNAIVLAPGQDDAMGLH